VRQETETTLGAGHIQELETTIAAGHIQTLETTIEVGHVRELETTIEVARVQGLETTIAARQETTKIEPISWRSFTMTTTPDDSHVTAELRDAFEQAVAAYANWYLGGPEPPVALERRVTSIDAVCGLLMSFGDRTPMPDQIYDVLCTLAEQSNGAQAAPAYIGKTINRPQDRSYASGARCLAALFDARKAWYRFKDQQRS